MPVKSKRDELIDKLIERVDNLESRLREQERLEQLAVTQNVTRTTFENDLTVLGKLGVGADNAGLATIEISENGTLPGLKLKHGGANLHATIEGPVSRSLRFKLDDNNDDDFFEFHTSLGKVLSINRRGYIYEDFLATGLRYRRIYSDPTNDFWRLEGQRTNDAFPIGTTWVSVANSISSNFGANDTRGGYLIQGTLSMDDGSSNHRPCLFAGHVRALVTGTAVTGIGAIIHDFSAGIISAIGFRYTAGDNLELGVSVVTSSCVAAFIDYTITKQNL